MGSTTVLKAETTIRGLSYPHKWKEEQWSRAFKAKDRRGATEEAAPIPAISAGNRGRLQEAAV
jgi:hypothetical protein